MDRSRVLMLRLNMRLPLHHQKITLSKKVIELSMLVPCMLDFLLYNLPLGFFPAGSLTTTPETNVIEVEVITTDKEVPVLNHSQGCKKRPTRPSTRRGLGTRWLAEGNWSNSA